MQLDGDTNQQQELQPNSSGGDVVMAGSDQDPAANTNAAMRVETASNHQRKSIEKSVEVDTSLLII